MNRLTGWLASAGLALAPLGVHGAQITAGGRSVALHGVNRSGLEYTCIQNNGFFDSPHPDRIDDASMIAAMRSWAIDVVRVPLNEDCWLGINAPAAYSGVRYRRIVAQYVAALHRAGLYVILDLHWAAPGRAPATGQAPMADADHAPAFWRSVAGTFRHDRAVMFDLYNEPFGIDWNCWRNGCRVGAGGGQGASWPAYRTAGMQTLVNTVRATGARQPILLGGLNYAFDDWAMPSHLPHDSAHALVASQHDYGGLSPCDNPCRAQLVALHRHLPVLLGELGETDCQHTYLDGMMQLADAHGIGYLGWAWDTAGCGSGPSLITDYRGDPTPFGIGLRDHLRALARR